MITIIFLLIIEKFCRQKIAGLFLWKRKINTFKINLFSHQTLLQHFIPYKLDQSFLCFVVFYNSFILSIFVLIYHIIFQ